MKQIWMIAILAIVMVARDAESGVGSWLVKAGKVAVRTCARGGRKVLSEGAEVAIRKACPGLADDAVKLAGRYGDDMVRVLSRHGDEAVRLAMKHGDSVALALAKHGDEVMRIAGKYGDEGVRCLAREGDTAIALMKQHGDEVVEVLMKHEGIGKHMVEIYGGESVKIGSKVTDEGAADLVRYGRQLSSVEAREIAEEIAKRPHELGGKEVFKIILRKAPHIGAGVGMIMVAGSVQGGVKAVTKKVEQSSAGSLYWGIAGLTLIIAGAWMARGMAIAWVRERGKRK